MMKNRLKWHDFHPVFIRFLINKKSIKIDFFLNNPQKSDFSDFLKITDFNRFFVIKNRFQPIFKFLCGLS